MGRLGVFSFLLLALLMLSVTPGQAARGNDKEVVGWIQYVRLYPGALQLKAKMDTGAQTSSLNVEHIESFNRNGAKWVRFSVTNAEGHSVTFERPEVRIVRIKRQFGRVQARPVVMLGLCLGSIFKLTPLDLANRQGFNYQLLVGRRFLKGEFLIDPDSTFVKPPHCFVRLSP